MALPEICYESLAGLIEGFHAQLDADYTTETLSKLSSVILDLTELMFSLIYTSEMAEEFKKFHGADKPVKLRAEYTTIRSLMSNRLNHCAFEGGVAAVTKIASVNPAIRDAVLNAYNWEQSPAGISERLREEELISVEPVYQRIKS
jgi:hypothetical protein